MPSPKSSRQRKPRRKARSGGHAAAKGSARSQLLDKMREQPEFDKAVILDEHPDVEKMSEVLLKYAEPLTEPLPEHDDASFRKTIAFAVMCWNAALSIKLEREEIFRQFISQTPPTKEFPVEEVRGFFDFMIERKHRLFKDNKRWIVNYEIKFTKRDRHVYVASTLEPKQLKTLLPTERRPWWKRLLFWRK